MIHFSTSRYMYRCPTASVTLPISGTSARYTGYMAVNAMKNDRIKPSSPLQ